MGLDISAYRQINKLNAHALEKDSEGFAVDEDVFWMRDVQSDWFPRQCADLELDCYYDYGCEVFSFRAGSYGGYSHWRNWLADIVDVVIDDLTNNDTTAFAELLYFSDCEGYIGPRVSAKLALDFALYDEKARAVDEEHKWFYEIYCRFRRAFEIAQDSGVVHFH